jgi:thioester reductase-like protein
MNLRLDDARRSAVDSAKHVIDFARACRDAGQLRKVEFLSTVGVGGRLPGSVPERWISEPRRFHNTYEQAKAEAELIVERAILNGLPITVHRPSMVVGNSTTGKVMHFQVFYYLIEFLSGQQTFGLFPNPGSTRLDVVPVDHVAEAVLWSSGCPDTSGKILHLCAGPDRALDLVDLRRLVRASFQDAGINLPRSTTVPASIFRAAIAVLRRVTYRPYRRTLGSVPIFLDYLAERQFFANYETAKRLQQAGISTPSPSAFLPTVIGYYLERRRTRHAA